jgi:hypothetical protein
MPLPSMDAARGWLGQTLLDGNGDAADHISDIYMDQESAQPEWALVDTGRAGRLSTFVPLLDATPEGEAVRVPYSRASIDGAPSVEPDGEVSQDDEARLYDHYGLAYSMAESNTGLPRGAAAPVGTATEPVADGTDSVPGPDMTPDGSGRPASHPRLRRYTPAPRTSTPPGESTAPTTEQDIAAETSSSAGKDAPQTALPARAASILGGPWVLPVVGGLLAALALLARRRGRDKRASRSGRPTTVARAYARRGR